MGEVLHILQHALGLDQFGRGKSYRDHFVAGPGHSDYETCQDATAQGLMLHVENPHVVGGNIFFVTPLGVDYVRYNSPLPPKLTTSQRRYRAYLDSDSDLPFIEWVKLYGNRIHHSGREDR